MAGSFITTSSHLLSRGRFTVSPVWLPCVAVCIMLLAASMALRAANAQADPLALSEIALNDRVYRLDELGELAPVEPGTAEVTKQEILAQVERGEALRVQADITYKMVTGKSEWFYNFASALLRGINARAEENRTGSFSNMPEKLAFMGPFTERRRIAFKEGKLKIESIRGNEHDYESAFDGEKTWMYYPRENTASVARGGSKSDTMLDELLLTVNGSTVSALLSKDKACFVGMQAVGTWKCCTFEIADDGLLTRIWISPEHDYLVKRVLRVSLTGNHDLLVWDVAEFQQQGEFYYAAKGCHAWAIGRDADGEGRVLTWNRLSTWEAVSCSPCVPDGLFAIIFPHGARVTDGVRGVEYVVE